MKIIKVFGNLLMVGVGAYQNCQMVRAGVSGLKEDCRLAYEFINGLRQKTAG